MRVGRQHIGSYLNAAAYNIVAIPLSLTMAFVLHWELIGLWTGVSVALILIAASETLIIFYTDWDKVRWPPYATGIDHPLTDVCRLSMLQRRELTTASLSTFSPGYL